MSPATVLQELETLRARVEEKDRVALDHAIALIEQMGGQLKGMKFLASQRFRASSEKVAPGQLAMQFIEHLIAQAQRPADNGKHADPPKRDKRPSRVKLLPVRTVDKTLCDVALRCTCGHLKHAIGYDTRRQIIYEPAQLYMQEERL